LIHDHQLLSAETFQAYLREQEEGKKKKIRGQIYYALSKVKTYSEKERQDFLSKAISIDQDLFEGLFDQVQIFYAADDFEALREVFAKIESRLSFYREEHENKKENVTFSLEKVNQLQRRYQQWRKRVDRIEEIVDGVGDLHLQGRTILDYESDSLEGRERALQGARQNYSDTLKRLVETDEQYQKQKAIAVLAGGKEVADAWEGSFKNQVQQKILETLPERLSQTFAALNGKDKERLLEKILATFEARLKENKVEEAKAFYQWLVLNQKDLKIKPFTLPLFKLRLYLAEGNESFALELFKSFKEPELRAEALFAFGSFFETRRAERGTYGYRQAEYQEQQYRRKALAHFQELLEMDLHYLSSKRLQAAVEKRLSLEKTFKDKVAFTQLKVELLKMLLRKKGTLSKKENLELFRYAVKLTGELQQDPEVAKVFKPAINRF